MARIGWLRISTYTNAAIVIFFSEPSRSSRKYCHDCSKKYADQRADHIVRCQPGRNSACDLRAEHRQES